MTTTTAPRIDALVDATSGLSTQLSTPAVNLTYRTATTATGAPSAGLFHSTIVGRAKMVDLSNDLGVRMGIDRVMTHDLAIIPSELGPNNEPVYKTTNDKFNQIRFVGLGWIASPNSSVGPAIVTSGTAEQNGSFVEITFYGTGLNVLVGYIDAQDRGYSISVDGVAAGSLVVGGSGGSVLNVRQYSQNAIYNVVSGLTLGLHTVKLTVNAASNGRHIHGFEILNDQFLTTTANTNSSTSLTSVASTTGLVVGMDITGAGIPANTTISAISGNTITMSAAATTASGVSVKFGANALKVASGSSSVSGAGRTLSSLTGTVYNSNFESGTLGTRGGRVVVYHKADGTIGKALTPTNSSAAYLNSADHTNEEVIRSYHWREFGCGRSDDFSYAVSGASSDKAFTLDDNTTTLTGYQNRMSIPTLGSSHDGLELNGGNTGFTTITFVGTGLDIVFTGSAGNRLYDGVSIDGGASIGSVVKAGNYLSVQKIVSGLPYGTHTVRLYQTVEPADSCAIVTINTYAPKKPSIPASAIELAEYFIMADHAANTTANINAIGTGVLRKQNTREVVLSGTWPAMPPVNPTLYISGFEIYTQTINNYYELVFFGTGIEIRGQTNTGWSATNAVTIDGLAATTANFPSLTSSHYGGYVFSAGNLSIAASNTTGSGCSIKGLPLGLHRVRVTNGTNTNLVLGAIDVITPIHAPKYNTPYVVQGALSVGSQGVGDNRQFGDQLPKLPSFTQNRGQASNPTTTSTTFTQMNEMCTSIKTTGNPIRVLWNGTVTSGSVGQGFIFKIYVDGAPIEAQRVTEYANAGYYQNLTISTIIPVSSGVHNINIFWRTGAGTLTNRADERTLIVEEIANS
jgi:hypothetical protein